MISIVGCLSAIDGILFNYPPDHTGNQVSELYELIKWCVNSNMKERKNGKGVISEGKGFRLDYLS